jgi:hypothetical protein
VRSLVFRCARRIVETIDLVMYLYGRKFQMLADFEQSVSAEGCGLAGKLGVCLVIWVMLCMQGWILNPSCKATPELLKVYLSSAFQTRSVPFFSLQSSDCLRPTVGAQNHSRTSSQPSAASLFGWRAPGFGYWKQGEKGSPIGTPKRDTGGHFFHF